jgi:hypothetical protein
MIYRTTDNPDWIANRIDRYEKALFCWQSNTIDSSFDKCRRAVKYTLEHILPPYTDPDETQDDKYLKTFRPDEPYRMAVFDNIKDLRKKRMDLRTVQIPVLGLTLDAKDVGFTCVHNTYRFIYYPIWGYRSRTPHLSADP